MTADGDGDVEAVALLSQSVLIDDDAELADAILSDNPSLLDECEKPLLHIACSKGSLDVVTVLLRHGADVLGCDVRFRRPLHCAAQCRNADSRTQIMSVLLAEHDRHKDLRRIMLARDKQGYTCIHAAAAVPNNGEAVSLLLKNKASAELGSHSKFPHLKTPLVLACMASCLDSVKKLLKAKAYVNTGGGSNPTSDSVPLICAAKNGWIDGIQALVDAKAYVDARDSEGMTATHWSFLAEHADCAEWLVSKAGASLTLQDKCGKTPVDLAPDLLPPIQELHRQSNSIDRMGSGTLKFDGSEDDRQGNMATPVSVKHATNNIKHDAKVVISNKQSMMPKAKKVERSSLSPSYGYQEQRTQVDNNVSSSSPMITDRVTIATRSKELVQNLGHGRHLGGTLSGSSVQQNVKVSRGAASLIQRVRHRLSNAISFAQTAIVDVDNTDLSSETCSSSFDDDICAPYHDDLIPWGENDDNKSNDVLLSLPDIGSAIARATRKSNQKDNKQIRDSDSTVVKLPSIQRKRSASAPVKLRPQQTKSYQNKGDKQVAAIGAAAAGQNEKNATSSCLKDYNHLNPRMKLQKNSLRVQTKTSTQKTLRTTGRNARRSKVRSIMKETKKVKKAREAAKKSSLAKAKKTKKPSTIQQGNRSQLHTSNKLRQKDKTKKPAFGVGLLMQDPDILAMLGEL